MPSSGMNSTTKSVPREERGGVELVNVRVPGTDETGTALQGVVNECFDSSDGELEKPSTVKSSANQQTTDLTLSPQVS